jgi:hypothetical protein
VVSTPVPDSSEFEIPASAPHDEKKP